MRKGRSELGVARRHSSVTIPVAREKRYGGHAFADLALVESKVTEVDLARNNETILRLAYATTFNTNAHEHQTGPSSAFVLISSPTDTSYSPANRETLCFVTIIKRRQWLCAPLSCCVYDGTCLSSAADFTYCVLRSCDDLSVCCPPLTTRRRPQISRFASVRHGDIRWEDHAQRQKQTRDLNLPALSRYGPGMK